MKDVLKEPLMLERYAHTEVCCLLKLILSLFWQGLGRKGVSLTGSASQKLCKECFCNHPTYGPDFALLLFPLSTSVAETCQPGWQGKVPPLVPCRLMGSGLVPTFTSRHGATVQGHGCYPLINEDGQKTGRKQSCAQPISCGAGVNNDNTTRLSPLIKGYKQLGKQHPRQAVALVECCTSVTQNKRRAGIIRVATLVRGTTANSKPRRFQQCRHLLDFSCCGVALRGGVSCGAASDEAPAELFDLQTALIMLRATDD